MRKKKQHPYKYLKYKGCFGYSLHTGKYIGMRNKEVHLGENIGIYDENIFANVTNVFNSLLENPEQVLNMRKVKEISIKGGLFLKAFFDEFCIKHNKHPMIKGPKHHKTRAILKYLEIKKYQDVKVEHYPDIMCWDIRSWDHSSENIEFGKILDTEIIPKCWKGNHAISRHSSTIAMSVAEAILNCKEHAYTGEKENYHFKRWYLGVGEYPDTKKFSFCVYDKGIGIKARLRSNPTGWLESISDGIKSDSSMIELATKGKRVIADDGRGQGLKSAIELLEKNNGEIDIYSDCGYFSSDDDMSGKDRGPRLEGTMVAFSFPVEYSGDNL